MRLRPHGSALVLPAGVLVLVMGAAGFLAAAVPASSHRGALRAAVALVALLVVLRACAVPFLRWATTTLTVTDRRVSTRQGILRSRTRDVSLWRIADVVVERSLAQRLIGSGTLLLDTTGERGGLVVRDVPGVVAVADELNALLDDLDDAPPDEQGRLAEEAGLDEDEQDQAR